MDEKELMDAGGDLYRDRVASDPTVTAHSLSGCVHDLASGLVEDVRLVEIAADLVYEGMLRAEEERNANR
jgi:hypothetical protein